MTDPVPDPDALLERRLSGWQPDLTGTLLFVMNGPRVLLMRKKRGHGAGRINAPGGKLEPGETPLECAIRETREETGLIVEATRLLGLYSRPQAAVVVAAYEARIVDGRMGPTAEALDVRPFAVADIPWAELAFNTTLWALRDWARSVDPAIDVASLGRESVDR